MKTLQAYRCRFCGEVYLGDNPPSHCPYCGAFQKEMVPAADWRELETVELSDRTKANLESAYQLELNNVNFYRSVGGAAISTEWQGIFKYLARVEGMHAATIRRFLQGVKISQSSEDVSAKNDLLADVHELLKREERAEKLYGQVLKETIEEPVRQIFQTLVEVEAEHYKIAKAYLQNTSI